MEPSLFSFSGSPSSTSPLVTFLEYSFYLLLITFSSRRSTFLPLPSPTLLHFPPVAIVIRKVVAPRHLIHDLSPPLLELFFSLPPPPLHLFLSSSPHFPGKESSRPFTFFVQPSRSPLERVFLLFSLPLLCGGDPLQCLPSSPLVTDFRRFDVCLVLPHAFLQVDFPARPSSFFLRSPSPVSAFSPFYLLPFRPTLRAHL